MPREPEFENVWLRMKPGFRSLQRINPQHAAELDQMIWRIEGMFLTTNSRSQPFNMTRVAEDQQKAAEREKEKATREHMKAFNTYNKSSTNFKEAWISLTDYYRNTYNPLYSVDATNEMRNNMWEGFVYFYGRCPAEQQRILNECRGRLTKQYNEEFGLTINSQPTSENPQNSA